MHIARLVQEDSPPSQTRSNSTRDWPVCCGSVSRHAGTQHSVPQLQQPSRNGHQSRLAPTPRPPPPTPIPTTHLLLNDDLFLQVTTNGNECCLQRERDKMLTGSARAAERPAAVRIQWGTRSHPGGTANSVPGS